LEFEGARVLGEVWERLRREAKAHARQDFADRHAKRAFQSGPERQVDWHKVEEPISPSWRAEWKRTRTGTVELDPGELASGEAASDVVVRTMADAFEEDEKMRKPVPTGMPREKPVPKQRPAPYAKCPPKEVDEEKVKEDMEHFKQRFKTKMAVLMLGHRRGGPLHLPTWYKWATETGREGTMIFINHKEEDWPIPDEYAGVIVRLPYPEFEVRDTAWGRSSLVDATLNLLVYAFNNGAGGFSHYAVVSEDTVPLARADTFRHPVRLNPHESRIVKYNNQANRNQFVGMSEALVQWQVANPPGDDCTQKQNWWVQQYARDAEIGDAGYLDVNEEKDEMGMDDAGRMLPVVEDSYQIADDWVDSFWNKRRVIGSEDGPTQEEADAAVAAWDAANPPQEDEEDEESESEEEDMRYTYHMFKNPQQFFTHSQWMVLCEEDAAFCVQSIETLRTMAADYDLLFGLAPDDEATPYSLHEVIAADEIVIGTFLMINGIRPSSNVLLAESGDGDHAAVHPTVAALRAADGRSHNAMFGRKLQTRLEGNDIVTWA